MVTPQLPQSQNLGGSQPPTLPGLTPMYYPLPLPCWRWHCAPHQIIQACIRLLCWSCNSNCAVEWHFTVSSFLSYCKAYANGISYSQCVNSFVLYFSGVV